MNWRSILKNIGYLLIFAGIIGGAVWLVYFFFGQNQTLQNIVSSVFNSQPAAEQAAPAEKRLNAITADPIFDFWINKQNNSVYYLNPAGQVFKSSSGTETMVNSQTLASLNRVAPSYDGSYAVARFNYPNHLIFSIFNSASNSWQPLPITTIAAAWSPNSNDLAYVDNQGLKIMNMTTKKTQSIINLSQKDLDLRWRTDSKLLISSVMGDSTKVMLLDLKTRNLTPFLEEFGLVLKWAPDDSFGLKLSKVSGASHLSLIDKNGSELSALSFLTMPSKCVIDGTKMYCAVPKNIPDGLKLPEDYYQRSVYFDDAMYLIDLGSGTVSQISTGASDPIDAEHLEVLDGKLLFKNRLDDKLYSLTL